MDALIDEIIRESVALGRARCQLAAAESNWETPTDNVTVARLRMDVEAHETTTDIIQHELKSMYDRLHTLGGDF